jgi:hypothetical protein
MIIELFSTPIFLGNIDASKITLINEEFKNKWESETKTSFDSSPIIEKESGTYLLHTISKLLTPKFNRSFELCLTNIWSNKYEVEDYQEEHIHVNSDFSFIVYSKIKESKTVFLSCNRDLIQAFGLDKLFNTEFHLECRSNQIIIFPSFMKHRVKKNNEPGETIAGNLKIKFING